MRGESEGRIAAYAAGPLNEVTVEIVPSTLSLTPEQWSRVEPAVSRLRERGLVVTDDPIYRLEGWFEGHSLHLRLSERSYFDSVLLKQHPEWGVRSQVLALIGVTECSDGILMERRSENVAALPGHFHPVPSGSVQPPMHPYHTFFQEAREELGLKPEEVSEPELLALLYAETSGIYLLVARARTSLDLATLSARSCSGEWERSELFALPMEAGTYHRWIVENRAELTPAGRTALILEGERRWGLEWSEGLFS